MAFAERGDNTRAWELLSMINPVHHTQTPEKTAIYKNEPYVVSADVYAVSPHTGRGGWSWYTGSAGWLYRLMLETLLGLRLEEGTLKFKPCLPADWKEYKIHYRYRETTYHISVVQRTDGKRDEKRDAEAAIDPVVTVDGVLQAAPVVTLVDDRREHYVEVRVGESPEAIESRRPEEKE
jgi:cellobiose phosphorylase